MCDTGGIIGAGVGAVGGFFVGGPAGSVAGASVGYGLGHQIGASGGDDYEMQNPGNIDMASSNPEMYQELQLARQQRDQQQDFQQQFLNPDRYNQMTRRQEIQAQTAAMNNANATGMAGSSAAAGNVNQATFNVDQGMIDRQLSDHMQIAQMNQILNGQVTGDILGIQGQFAQMQIAQMQAAMGKSQTDSANSNAIMGAGATIGGSMLGAQSMNSAAAAQQGAAGGANFGGYQSSNYGYMSGVPSDYSSPSFGQSSPYYGSQTPSSYGGLGTDYGYLK